MKNRIGEIWIEKWYHGDNIHLVVSPPKVANTNITFRHVTLNLKTGEKDAMYESEDDPLEIRSNYERVVL
jgi:hypothetical protein